MTARPEEKPIKTAVVGLGRAGWDIHIRALRDRQDYAVVAAVDVDGKRRAEAAQELGCAIYPDLPSCLAASPAELVIVANRSLDHGPDSIRALEAGRHVVVEKPMAMGLAEADRMIAAARRAGRLLTVHHSMRLEPHAVYVRKVVASGMLGEIFQVKIGEYGFYRRNDWQTLKAYGGGQLNNWGSHLIDQALQHLGAPVESVFGDLKRIAYLGDAEDHVKVVLRGTNGRVVDVELSGACALPLPRWVVMGSHGTLVVQGGQGHIRYYDPARVAPLEVVRESPPDRRYGNDDVLPWQEITEEAAAEPEVDFLSNLYAAIRHGEPLMVTPEQAREVMRIMDLCRQGTEFAL